MFSGSDDIPKREVNYDVRSFEVKCLQNEDVPDYALFQAVRNSLRGLARSMLVPLGGDAMVDDVFEQVDGFYGSVSTTETFMQQFFADGQKESEFIAAYASHLETTLAKDTTATDSMLKSKVLTRLKSQQLRNSTLHK